MLQLSEKLKKPFSLFLSSVFIISAFSCLPSVVSAADISYKETTAGTSEYVTKSDMFKCDPIDDDKFSIIGYYDEDPYILVPQYIGDRRVVELGAFAFGHAHYLKGIRINASIESIGRNAFTNCVNLEYAYIPSSVKELGGDAFASCESLKTITIPSSVTTMGTNVFMCCSGLEYISVPYGLSELPDQTFIDCFNLKSVDIGSNIVSIGNHVFMDCKKLDNVTIPDSVKSMGEDVFTGCISLKNIKISKSMSEIPSFTFYGCTSLENINIPENIKAIGKMAFYNCNSLKNVYIPPTVETIDEYAFGYTEGQFATDRLPVEGFAISGKKGSAAEKYAADNNIVFIDVDTILKNESTLGSDKFFEGVKVEINAAASGGTDPYKYAYYYKRSVNTKWNKIGTEFGTSSSASFTPVSAADYDIRVAVKDSSGEIAEKIFNITAEKNDPVVNTSEIISDKAQVGDDVRIDASAEGGSGSYRYAFYFKRSVNSRWNKIGTEFGTATHATLNPAAAADYDLKVIAKDSNGAVGEKLFKVTVLTSMELTNAGYINKPEMVKKNTTITIYGRSVGGTKPVKYEYYFKRSANSKWNTISPGNSSSTYAKFTPTAETSYNLKIVASDKKGTRAIKIITITAES